MLTLFRRHLKKCKAKEYDRTYRRCSCPIHIEGKCGGEFVRGSLHTANWEKAQLQVATAEGRGWWKVAPPGSETIKEPSAKIADAQARFLSNATKALKLSAPTLRKYATTFKRLNAFATAKGLTRLSEIDIELLREWQESWQLGPRTIQKEIERVRSFFKFCHQANYIQENPALLMSGPKKVKIIPKLPFTPDEMERILSSAAEIDLANGGHTDMLLATNDELISLILVMRYSGLRISDAAMLSDDRVQGGKLYLYTHKTGEHVCVPLPPFLVARLQSTRLRHGKYYFTGPHSTRMETVTDLLRRKLVRTMKHAKIEGQRHPHRFRDTFAVELLKDGVPLQDVSVLLGHSSIRVTEKHYAAWVRDRQLRLESHVEKGWERFKVLEGGKSKTGTSD